METTLPGGELGVALPVVRELWWSRTGLIEEKGERSRIAVRALGAFLIPRCHPRVRVASRGCDTVLLILII